MSIFKDRVANGKCGRCGKNDIQYRKQCDSCLEKIKEQQKNIRANRKENNMCILCGKNSPEKDLVHCVECRKKLADCISKKSLEYKRNSVYKSSRKLRQDVLTAYGGCCQCCGESQDIFLTIDHIDGKGADHRRKLTGKSRGGGSTIYRWLRNNNYPEGYQVLCWNCNWAKSHGGCPHKNKLD